MRLVRYRQRRKLLCYEFSRSTNSSEWVGSSAQTPRAASGQRRQASRDRPEGRTTSIFNVGGFFPGKLFPTAPPCRKNTRGQFARRSAFKESLRGSQARGSLSGRHRVVSAPAAPGSSPDKNRRRCCPAREAETSHGSSGASDLAPGSECGRAKEVAAFESVCRGRVPGRGEGSFPA